MTPSDEYQSRILVIDDEPEILETYKIILSACKTIGTTESRMRQLGKKLFNEDLEQRGEIRFDLEFADQGLMGVKKVKEYKDKEKPFAVVFLDMRMPPGQNGFETAKQIRTFDKDCNIVIVTAYNDVELSEIAGAVLPLDKLYYLKKPFSVNEIQQFAIGLSAKWKSEKMLDALIDERTDDLALTNIALQHEIEVRQAQENELLTEKELTKQKTAETESIATTIDVLFRKKHAKMKDTGERFANIFRKDILPEMQKLQSSALNPEQETSLHLIEKTLNDFYSSVQTNLSLENFELSPSQLKIANFIIEGKSSKEISSIMHATKRHIDFQREQIRIKLDIKNKKKNLKELLSQFQT